MDVSLRGRRALVTGGTRGIGAAIAKELRGAGAEVVVAGRESADLADADAVEAFARAVATERFDVLVNNAGISKPGAVGDVDLADWDRIQDVNVRAPMLLCRALAPKMADRGFGRIVNVTSIFGHVARSERAAYTTSKHALVGLTRALAMDYARRGVLANAVGPGVIETELTKTMLGKDGMAQFAEKIPMGRLGNVDEIARVICFLASEANTYITGQHIMADGGYTTA